MRFLTGALTAAAIALAGAAYAQSDYPSEPLRIVVPTNAGGSVDTLARIFQLTIDEMGIFPSVVVVNQPGAGGTVGTRAIKDAASRCPGRPRHAVRERLLQLPDLRAVPRQSAHREIPASDRVLGQRDAL